MKSLRILLCVALLGVEELNAQLTAPADLTLNFTDAASFKIIDFDDDGLNDIIADNGNFTSTSESPASDFFLYHNEGNGNFTEIELLHFANDVLESWGDLNGDGLMDLVFLELTPFDPIQQVFVMWGLEGNLFSDPFLIFQTAESLEASSFYPMIQGICVGNLDGDADDDVIISCNYELNNPELSYDHIGFFHSLSWDGAGFDTPVSIASAEATPGGFFSLSRFFCEDFTNDGVDDIIALQLADFGSDFIVFPGDGTGGVSENTLYYPGGWDSHAWSNLDADAAQELVFSYGEYMVRLDVDGAVYYEQLAGDVPSPELCLIDTDHDGLRDILYGIGSGAITGSPGNIHLFKNGDPNGDWAMSVYDQLNGQDILQLAVSDLDQNGEEKIIAAQGGHLFLISVEATDPDPIPDFTSEIAETCSGQNIQFFDSSIGAITSWSWFFPGGNPSTSNQQNPTITYNIAGIYDVVLTVSDGTTEVSLTRSAFIHVLPLQIYFADTDGDGFGDNLNSISGCEQPIGFVLIDGDCDDNNNLIKPTAIEVCNSIDDDCDQQIDEGLGTLYFVDADGDGFGNSAVSVLSCTMPTGYVIIGGDCNDGNAAIKPGAIELCNNVNDDCDAFTDEGCGSAIVNDNPSGALSLIVNPFTVTNLVVGNLTNATVSPEATSSVITGQDLWYKFIAPAPGIRIRVQSSSTNLVVELQTMSGTVIDVENLNNSAGNEYLNYGALTEGQQYRIAIRNYNSAQGSGTFTISLNYLNDSFLIGNNTVLDYCQPIAAIPVSAFAYRFTLESNTTGLVYQVTQNLLTSLRLSKIPGLPAGDTYRVKINPIFNVTNGLGVVEQLIVNEVIVNQITINPWTQVYLSTVNACPNVMNQNSIVFLNGGVCRATDYQWQFVSQNGNNESITLLRGNSLISFNLSNAGLVNGGIYNVRVRPKFENGMFGDWGQERCLQIGANALFQELVIEQKNDQDENLEGISNSLVENILNPHFSLYPNPSSGESITIHLYAPMQEMMNCVVIDAMGRAVLETKMNQIGGSEFILDDLQGLSSGIYYFKIYTRDWEQTERLVIQ